MATTTATTISRGANDDRVIATAKQIVQSLNTTNREDMLLIFSSFDNRLSNITDLVRKEDSSALHLLKSAEGVIFGSDSDSFFNTEYLSAVDEILELLDNNLTLRSGSEIVDRAEAAVQVAMSRLEDEFRHILVRNTVPLDADRLYGSIRRLNSCFVANESEIDEFESFEEVDNENESGRAGFHERGRSLGDDCCVELIRFDAVSDLKEIADRMIRAGYEKECVQVYSNVRRDVLDECLVIIGVEKLSIEEVQKIEWRALDEKMKKWIQATKVGVKLLLSGEKSLCDQIFSGSDSAKEVCFNETVKGCLMQLLNFGEAVSIAKRSSEKLFRILDMYDVLSEVMPHLKAMVTDEFVLSEAIGVLAGLGEAAKDTFAEFEIAVRRENSKKPMIGGEIHPLTRYVMNYVKLVVDYSETLNSLLKDDEDNEAPGLQSGDVENLEEAEATPITRRLLALLATLEANLKQKSKLYEDGGMQYVFLMNNILYMVQKVKSSDLIKVLGDQWARRRRGQIRQHATAYLRASWSKALSCLKDEGIGGSSSNSHKVALKDRFKNFNAQFEEIYRAQTGWKVPDPQLRDELRISISEKVLPAYRSFFGRFGSQLEYGRNAGKYVKYTADDLENYLVDLFEGVPIVLHHLRRKSV